MSRAATSGVGLRPDGHEVSPETANDQETRSQKNTHFTPVVVDEVSL